jgi:acyl carrier protein
MTDPATNPSLTREQVRERLLAIMKENARVDPAQLRDEADLREELSLDSLDLTAVVNEVEIEFGITVPDEALKKVKTVGDIVEALWTRLKK